MGSPRPYRMAKSGELFGALIQQDSIPCLALTQKGNPCKKTVNSNEQEVRSTVSKIFEKIIVEELPVHSSRVVKLLEDLARLLICTVGHTSSQDDEQSDRIHDITTILKDRLKESDFSKAKIRKEIRAKLDREDASPSSAKGKREDNRSDDNQVAKPPVPQVKSNNNTRKSSATSENGLVTPPKPPRQNNLSKTSVVVDAPDTPESAVSIRSNPILSPPATDSSATSIDSSRQNRRQTRSSPRQEDDSPTRGPAARIAARRHRASYSPDLCEELDSLSLADFVVSDSATDSDFSVRNDDESEERSADESDLDRPVGRFRPSQHVESEAVSTDEEEPLEVAQAGTQDMEFHDPSDKVDGLVHALLKHMRKVPGPETLGSGYIYWFLEKSGYWKIGFTKLELSHDDPDAIATAGTGSKKLWKRIKQQEKLCKYQITEQYAMYMPCAARRMESMIHQTLRLENTLVKKCRSMTCTTKHKEWFRISQEKIVRVVRIWKAFSDQIPYSKRGRLRYCWDNYAHDTAKMLANHKPDVWVEKSWGSFVLENKDANDKYRRFKKLEKEVRHLERKKVAILESMNKSNQQRVKSELEMIGKQLDRTKRDMQGLKGREDAIVE